MRYIPIVLCAFLVLIQIPGVVHGSYIAIFALVFTSVVTGWCAMGLWTEKLLRDSHECK